MDWFPWFFGTTLYVPPAPATTQNGRPLPTDLDLELLRVLYLVIANESSCAACGHLLGRGLHVRNATGASSPRWPVRIDTRCWGWRRHPHLARVTQPGNDLVLGVLEPRTR